MAKSKPSTRLSESRDTLQSISAQCKAEPAKLVASPRGYEDAAPTGGGATGNTRGSETPLYFSGTSRTITIRRKRERRLVPSRPSASPSR